MDPILQREDHFSGDENTSEEQRRAKVKFPFKGRVFFKQKMQAEEEEEPPREEEEDDDDAFFAELQSNMDKVTFTPDAKELETYNEHKDPVTCYVQNVVASTVFGANLPKTPPKWGVDSPALFLDKTFYHQSVVGADRFRREYHEPMVERVTRKMQTLLSPSPIMLEFHRMLADCPEMSCTLTSIRGHTSIWTNTPLEEEHFEIVLNKEKNKTEPRTVYLEPEHTVRLCGIHVVYHLWRYVNASYVQNYKTEDIANLNFMELWVHLVGDDLATLPVSDWDDPLFEPFAERIFKIFQEYQAIDAWSKI